MTQPIFAFSFTKLPFNAIAFCGILFCYFSLLMWHAIFGRPPQCWTAHPDPVFFAVSSILSCAVDLIHLDNSWIASHPPAVTFDGVDERCALIEIEIGRATSELQSRSHHVCRLLLEQ